MKNDILERKTLCKKISIKRLEELCSLYVSAPRDYMWVSGAELTKYFLHGEVWVIEKDGRIVSACCIVPLSCDCDISKTLFTAMPRNYTLDKLHKSMVVCPVILSDKSDENDDALLLNNCVARCVTMFKAKNIFAPVPIKFCTGLKPYFDLGLRMCATRPLSYLRAHYIFTSVNKNLIGEKRKVDIKETKELGRLLEDGYVGTNIHIYEEKEYIILEK